MHFGGPLSSLQTEVWQQVLASFPSLEEQRMNGTNQGMLRSTSTGDIICSIEFLIGVPSCWLQGAGCVQF